MICIPILLPPLRERREDVPVLAQFFLKRFSLETKRNFTGFVKEAEARLISYGNVRELANLIEGAVVLGQGPELSTDGLPLRSIALEENNSNESLSYRQALESAKRDVVARALACTQGNRAAAAGILGLHKTHLLNLMNSLRIE